MQETKIFEVMTRLLFDSREAQLSITFDLTIVNSNDEMFQLIAIDIARLLLVEQIE
jgi:hypothetical protein